MFKTYYTNVYFGTVSNISFVNDHVLASQEALLCDWVTQIITPELESILRKADPDPEENEAALPSLTYLIGSIDVLLEANPHTVLENLVNIVPALMSVDPNLGEIVNKLFTKMVQTLSMTRQLDVYFSKLALSFKEQNVAFSNDRHYSISSATHLRSLAKATSESMPFAQAIPTARYLMEMLSEITQATMTKKSENHIEMSHLTLALLLTHLVLGATQNNLTPTQCDSWQEFLEWSYLEISGIMIRTQGADQNDLVKWLYLYIHHTWVDIGSRLGGNDEWLETHIQPSALEPYISLTEWQAGTKNLNSQPRSYQIYMLSLYTLLQAFAYSQTTSCLGTEDIANTISLENRKSKYREQWVQKLTIVLKHFCIWSENGLLSNQDQCGWMPWDGLPHTINAGNFGTAQYRLFSDWLELICAFSDAPTCLEAVTTIMRLVFITSAKNSTTTQSLPKDANFVTPMTISLKLLSSADFYETTQVQKVFTRALASTLNNALREIVGVVNPKCQVLKKVETITGYLCSGANAKTEALRKGLVKFTAELYTNKAKPQKDLWISQIFWASKVTKRPSSDADSHGDKISHKVIALEEILLTLHRFPLACISIDHILALSLYLVTIDREISELCTQHWKETCPSWSYDDQFYTHQKVESVMVSCRSWILRACEASQSVLSTLTGMDWVFKWIFRSATTSNNRSLLDLSGRLLSSFVMCKMGETAPKGSSSNIISKLRFSTTISEELDPFITSEKCSLNITSLHIRCLEAALKYFGSKREKSHEDLGEFVSQELDTVVEKIIKFASNSDEFTEAVKNGILAAQLSQYNLLLKAKGHDKMAIQTMDAIIAKLSNRTSKMLNEPRGSGDFENALLSFGCDLCIFAANSIDRITIKDSNNEEPIPNSISGRIARFLALNILILSAANESRETYSYGNTSTSCITSLATQGKPNLGYAEIILQYSFNQALRSLDANMLELIMGQLLTIATTAQDASRNQAAIDMVKICISAANRPLNSKVSETHKCIQKRALEVLATIELVLARCNRLSVTESALDAVLEIVAGSGVRLTPHIISVVINVLSTITQRPQIATGFAVPNSETFELLYKKIIVILSRIIRNHASEAVKTIPSIITLLRLLLHAFVVPSLWDNVTRESHNSFVLKSPWIIAYAPFSASCATEYARFLEYLVHSHTSELTKSSLIRPTGPNSAQYGQYTTSRAYARGTRAGGMAKMLSRYVPYLLSEYCAIQGGAAILPTPPPSGMHAFSSTHSDEGQHPSRRFQGMAWRPSLVDMTNLEIEKQMHEIKQDTHVTKKKYQKYQKGLISDPEIREALLPGWYALLDIINDEGRAMVIAAFNPASMLGSQNGSIHIPASLGGAREVLRSLHHDYLQYHKYSGQF
ncbi:hypothetical protein H4219_000496 [Mycoemilia scoparia]|uniref:Nucleolar 27S pre-rRNA processing Urb2/Npa2 C-terminal domain-containing protein n=1 Tax=Mycoemilia scoparia TaxID=417184 RepID=A0A9W8DXC1_9FUNG|nr:hypothetical protein H4219_000496 [Mycoemilia scoparia]